MDSERDVLYKKINKRVDKMISLGLEKEAKNLFTQTPKPSNCWLQ